MAQGPRGPWAPENQFMDLYISHRFVDPATLPVPRSRGTQAARAWRRAVLLRDHETCRLCGRRAHEAHHILPWARYPDARLLPHNGLALCAPCHARLRGREERTAHALLALVLPDPKVLPTDRTPGYVQISPRDV